MTPPGGSAAPTVSRTGWAVLAAAAVVGLYARLAGFGDRPLAVDEYYFLTSLQQIVDKGLPELPGGGLYFRGIVPQYLSAGVLAVFGATPGAARVVPLLCNLACVPVLYLYGRRLLGPLAWVPPALLLVSSWEIEFARFARMYAPFQLATLLLMLSIDRAYFERSWGRYWPHVFMVVANLCHALGLLLLPLLLLPLALTGGAGPLTGVASRLRYGALTVVAFSFCVARDRFGPGRGGGAADPFPAGYELPVLPLLRLPELPFWSFGGAQASLFAAIGVASLAAAMAAGVQLVRRRNPGPAALATGAIAAALFHQLVPALLLAAALFIRFGIAPRPDTPDRASRGFALVGVAVVGGIAAAWLAVGTLGDTWWDAGSRLGAIRRAFFGWPDYFRPVVDPWIRELPDVGLLVGAAVAFQFATRLARPLAELLSNPSVVIVMIATAFGALRSDYTSTRYIFFVYPLGLVCVVLAAQDVFARIAARWPDRRVPSAALAVFALFALTSDFVPRHWFQIRSDEVTYRRGAFSGYEGVWYPRRDFVTPAERVMEDVSPGDRVVVVAQPAVSHYLDRPHAIFYRRSDPRFANVSRQRGTVDRWTGLRLLSTEEDLREYARGADRVWLVQGTAERERFLDPDRVWQTRRLAVERDTVGVDGRIEVILVHLDPQAEAAP